MPLYEDRRNAQNRIKVSQVCADSVITGSAAVAERIVNAIKEKSVKLGRPVCAALDGWYGIEWEKVLSHIKNADKEQNAGKEKNIANYISMSKYFHETEFLKEYKRKYITDDPAFGYVNDNGRVEELIDPDKAEQLKEELALFDGNTILYGCASATVLLKDSIDIIIYMDKTRQPILWQMWGGALAPFGSDKPDSSYAWKEYYYNDYHMLDHQKEYLYEKMDFWIEAIDPDNLKLIPRDSYHEIIKTLLNYPIKEIKIYQPGPWGAYRYKDLFEVPGLECNAWNELAGPELGMIVELNGGVSCEMPMLNLMQYQAEFLGKYLTQTYPRLFPMDVWLDDGYFSEKTPVERTAMPIHNHPSSDYVKRHFNEPLGRYETYYICEAYEGACTIMGYKDDIDLEEWERLCRESDNIKPIDNWKSFCPVWDSNIGDLYLIPPGTAHAHGGNQMVLEMDTCPSISATEYSFFEYDFARNSWDDNKMTMTAKPMKMHLEHGFDNEKWRRESWVKGHLLAKPKVEKWTKDYKFDRYSTIPEMPFEIEKFHFYTKAENNTEGKFAHIITLTIGKRVKIQSKANLEYSTEIELFQSAIIPACFGEYEIASIDGGFCEAVQLRWKKG